MLCDGHHRNVPKGLVPHTDNNVWPRYPSSTDNSENVFLCACVYICVCVCAHFSDQCKPAFWTQHCDRTGVKNAWNDSLEQKESCTSYTRQRVWERWDVMEGEEKTTGSGSGNTQPGRPNNNRLLPKRAHAQKHKGVWKYSSVFLLWESNTVY